MSNKKEVIVDSFLESHNMDYLFCILAEKESERLSILPESVKKTFKEKPTTMALKHIALNDVPDYIIEEYETNEEGEAKEPSDQTDLDSIIYEEEYEDDRRTKISKELDVFENFGRDPILDDIP